MAEKFFTPLVANMHGFAATVQGEIIPGAVVSLFPKDGDRGNNKQQWVFVDGYIANAENPNLVLAAPPDYENKGEAVLADKNNLIQLMLVDKRDHNSDFFRWTVVPSGPEPFNKVYIVNKKYPNFVLDIQNERKDPGTRLILYKRKKLEKSQNQLWSLPYWKPDSEEEISKYIPFGVDVLFLFDLTGSMSAWLAQAKEKAKEIVASIPEVDKRAQPRVGFTGYRDWQENASGTEIESIDFQDWENYANFQTFLDARAASGGGDVPENVALALEKANAADWQCLNKILVHIADAPPHGIKYTSLADAGDGLGRTFTDPEISVRQLATKGIDYYFIRIKSDTDQTTNIFQAAYNGTGTQFAIIDLGLSTDQFLPRVKDAIRNTLSRNGAFD